MATTDSQVSKALSEFKSLADSLANQRNNDATVSKLNRVYTIPTTGGTTYSLGGYEYLGFLRYFDEKAKNGYADPVQEYALDRGAKEFGSREAYLQVLRNQQNYLTGTDLQRLLESNIENWPAENGGLKSLSDTLKGIINIPSLTEEQISKAQDLRFTLADAQNEIDDNTLNKIADLRRQGKSAEADELSFISGVNERIETRNTVDLQDRQSIARQTRQIIDDLANSNYEKTIAAIEAKQSADLAAIEKTKPAFGAPKAQREVYNQAVDKINDGAQAEKILAGDIRQETYGYGTIVYNEVLSGQRNSQILNNRNTYKDIAKSIVNDATTGFAYKDPGVKDVNTNFFDQAYQYNRSPRQIAYDQLRDQIEAQMEANKVAAESKANATIADAKAKKDAKQISMSEYMDIRKAATEQATAEANSVNQELVKSRSAELGTMGTYSLLLKAGVSMFDPAIGSFMGDQTPLGEPTAAPAPAPRAPIAAPDLSSFSASETIPVTAARTTSGLGAIAPTTTTTTSAAPTASGPASPTSRAIAREILAATFVNEILGPDGKPVTDDPVGYVASWVEAIGPKAAVDYFASQGKKFTSGLKLELAPDIAREVATRAIKNLPANKLEYVSQWQPVFQTLGYEEGLKRLSDATGVGIDTLTGGNRFALDNMPDEASFMERNKTLLNEFNLAQRKELDDVIDRILAGEQVRAPIPEGLTPKEALTQIYLSMGNLNPTSDPDFARRLDYFETFGPEVGVALFNERFGILGIPGSKEVPIAAPPVVADFGTGNTFPSGSTPPTGTPTAPPGSTPTGSFPSYTAPSYTPPSGTTPTYTPPAGVSPYTPPAYAIPAYESRPLITEAERPSLDAAIEYIESTRPGAGPMQYITPGQLGSTFTPPTDYADVFGYTPYEVQTEAPAPGLRGGGSVAKEARGLAAMGRGEDTMLVHMTPDEVAGLRAIAMKEGTDLTINPETGLPEAGRLSRIFKKVILPAAAVYFGAPYLGGIQGASMLYGAARAAKTGSLQQGIMDGLTAYAGASAAQGMFGSSSGVFGAPSTAAPGAAPSGGGGSVDPSSGGVSSGTVDVASSVAMDPAYANATILQPPTGMAGPGTGGGVMTSSGLTGAGAAPPPPPSFGQKFTDATGISPTTAVIGGTMLAGLNEGDKEREAYEAEMRRRREEEERIRAQGLLAFERSNQPINTRTMYGAGGGLVALARGGMTYMEAGGTTGATGEPRMVAGTGDGMSDSVPATIEGVQEARLANDEFVVPADVVADIGNGSSSAGAKKLYDMMSRIREARHGTTEQPPEINAEQYMPA